eukprot:PhF_6_TR29680/c0_g1_i1/m.43748
MIVSGRSTADSAAVLFGTYAVTWARASSSSTVSCLHATTGLKAATALVGDSLVHVLDVSVSPDASLVVAIGSNEAGAPTAAIGMRRSVAIKTSHPLTKVLAID